MRTVSRLATLVASTIAIAGSAAFAPAAFAAPPSGGTMTIHCDLSSTACPLPFNPVISGPKPNAPQGCPSFLTTNHWNLNYVSGSAVIHETSNANGDWFTATAAGSAALTKADGKIEYAGHLTEWFGGGNNAAGQTDGGFTLSFT